ncbi:MAG TPA: ATP-binding cassette domain-containing protein [Patescibacteria group bacterium]|jgi:ABC-2 type transport system ATP-binding protein|nr:ATP-binding cassette domain-containing protein [Patescibacteria group bacterium]
MDDIISAQNLTKTFGNFTAVNNVSFNVKKGEIFAFLGPNGAGKTTTIKMLTTLLKPTAGTIRLNGIDTIAHPEKARKSFGIVFQDPSLDDELTAMENMEFHAVLYKVPGREIKGRIEKFLNFVELWDRKNDLVKTFSGGMKRRLEIARGLLHQPEILFLDEPTQGLDPQTRNKIWEYLQNLNKETQITVFFTTHYMEEAEQIAHRIAIMDHGKIIETGTAAKLMEQTQTKSLEKAFLKLTGTAIRDEEASGVDKLRGHAMRWRGR